MGDKITAKNVVSGFNVPVVPGIARPGLTDAELTVDFQAETSPNDVVTVLATAPLTSNEAWTLMRSGEWRLWRRGECIADGSVYFSLSKYEESGKDYGQLVNVEYDAQARHHHRHSGRRDDCQ